MRELAEQQEHMEHRMQVQQHRWNEVQSELEQLRRESKVLRDPEDEWLAARPWKPITGAALEFASFPRLHKTARCLLESAVAGFQGFKVAVLPLAGEEVRVFGQSDASITSFQVQPWERGAEGSLEQAVAGVMLRTGRECRQS